MEGNQIQKILLIFHKSYQKGDFNKLDKVFAIYWREKDDVISDETELKNGSWEHQLVYQKITSRKNISLEWQVNYIHKRTTGDVVSSFGRWDTISMTYPSSSHYLSYPSSCTTWRFQNFYITKKSKESYSLL